MGVDQNVNGDKQHEYPMKLQNSDVLANLDGKLGHLSDNVQCELKQIIHEREDIFPDVPSRTNAADHDVDVGDHEAIKQHPYRVNPLKRAHLNRRLNMLQNNIIEPSKSEWSSPCILVPKPDGSFRFVTDFRKVNQCTKTDSYPIPRRHIDDCIDKIGNAKFVSKFDLLKGYSSPYWWRQRNFSLLHPRRALSISSHALWYEKRTGNLSKNGQSHCSWHRRLWSLCRWYDYLQPANLGTAHWATPSLVW